MKTVSAFALAALFMCAEVGSAQDRRPTITGAEAAVVIAALEYYTTPENLTDDGRTKTFVISGTTNGWVSLPPGVLQTRAQPQRPVSAMDLPPGLIRRLEVRSGKDVEICSEIDATHSLCGISGPWLWLVYDLPSIVGDSARMTMTLLWLEFGEPRVGRGEVHNANYDLLLAREKGAWAVKEIRPSGVS